MLQQLQIKNYAIIDFIEINFNKGLTIITGETGAGKSILMGALGLILGERTDASVLQQKENKCIHLYIKCLRCNFMGIISKEYFKNK